MIPKWKIYIDEQSIKSVNLNSLENLYHSKSRCYTDSSVKENIMYANKTASEMSF